MADKPKSLSKELERADEQFKAFDDQVKSLTVDEVAKATLHETEPQTKLSDREANKMDAPVIKPSRTMSCKNKFNERFRAEYEEDRQLVKCIAENNEVKGETIELWTKFYPGVPAEFWQVPVGKPVYLPKYVAKRLSECEYHRFVMEDSINTGTDGMGTYHGALAVKETRRRLDCRPVGFGFVPMTR